jgi:hypothetical protein
MAAGKSKKLKVFQAPFGFYDSVVAAPSQAAALRAWGSHQNLFAEGVAQVVTDEKIVAAALAHPELPLRRAVGSNGAFELEPSSRPSVPDAPKGAKEKAFKEPKKPAAKKAPPPDRSALDEAEKSLRDLSEKLKAEEAEFERKREQLNDDEARAQLAYSDARRAAAAAVEKARKAYAKAGGSN